MKIQGAALINRFYIRDGWTKEKVAGLLLSPEKWEDKMKCVEERSFPEYLQDGTEEQVPAYYAVYESFMGDANPVFDKEKVEKHEYQPFESDGGFETKNTWR